MKLAGRVGWVGVVSALALLAAGGIAVDRTRGPGIAPELRLVASPEDVELTWGAAPERAAGVRGRPDIAREQSATLPPWFGLRASPALRIAGHVRGGTGPMTIRLAIDVPDPGVWTGREVAVGADGAFDFGPMRAGAYLLVASAPRQRSRVMRLDTTAASAEHVELAIAPCQRIAGGVERPTKAGSSDWGPASGASIELAGAAVATTGSEGRFALCAADDEDLWIRVPGFAVTRWNRTHGFARGDAAAAVARDEVATGTVFEADGAPAAGVGVQPIWGSLLGYPRCDESAVVVTTDRDGRFTYVGDRRICGLRILRGSAMFEAPLLARPLSLQPPPPPPPPPKGPSTNAWPDAPLPPPGPVTTVAPIVITAGHRGHLIVRLTDPVRDRAAGFVALRVRTSGEHGVWVHGRALHAGLPVTDAVVTVTYHPVRYIDYWDTVLARRDGSFDAFMPLPESDDPTDRHVAIQASDHHAWTGDAELDLGTGQRDVTIELRGSTEQD